MDNNLRPLAEFIAEQRAEAIDERVVNIEGKEYLVMGGGVHDADHRAMLSKIVTPETVHLTTLQGLVDFFGAGISGTDDLFVRISDPTVVYAEAKSRLADGTLPALAEATYTPPFDKFGDWMEAGEFVTWLLTGFVANVASDELLKILGKGVKIEAVRQVSDDGVSSQIKRSRGSKIEWTDDLKTRFTLRPRRTFPEVDQPEVLCAWRFQDSGDDQPIRMKLVEADGGAWKAVAAASICEWLKEKLKDVPILR